MVLPALSASLQDLSIHGKQAWCASDAHHAASNPWVAAQSMSAAVHTPGSGHARSGTARSAPAVQHTTAGPSVTSHALSSRTSAPVATSTFSAFVTGTSALSPGQKAGSCSSNYQDSHGSADAAVNPSDMSLFQYSKQMHLTVHVPQHSAATPPSTNSSAAVTPSSATSTPTGSSMVSQNSRGTPGSPGSSGQQQSSASRHSSSANRSITPMRYTTGSVLAGFGGGGQGGMVRSPGSASHSIFSRSLPSGPLGLTRAPSVDRAVDRSMLRATLHTDTLRAADRIRTYDVAIERNVMSADPSLTPAAMRSYSTGSTMSSSHHSASNIGALNGPSAPIPTTPKPAAPGHKPNAGVARTLAPNGQPRKVPVAMLPQYHAGIGSKVMHGAVGSPPTTPLTHVATTGSIPTALDSSRIKSMQMRYTLHSK